MKYFNDSQFFLNWIHNFILHGFNNYPRLDDLKFLSTNLGVHEAIEKHLTEAIVEMEMVPDRGQELGSFNAELIWQKANQLSRILENKNFTSLLTSDSQQPREWLKKQLKQAKDFYFRVKVQDNPVFKQKKNYPYIAINGQHKYYLNNANKSLFGYQSNHDLYNYKEMERIFAKVHPIQSNFKIVKNPDFSNDIDLPKECIIEGVKFFYNPKQVNVKWIIKDNIPFLPNNQDEYYVVYANQKGIEEY